MGRHRAPEPGKAPELSAYHKQHQSQTDLPGLQQASQKHQQPQALPVRCGPARPQESGASPSYLSGPNGAVPKTGQQQTQEGEFEKPKTSKTEGLLLSRKAVLPSEVHPRERSTEDPWRGKGDEEQRTGLLSLSQALQVKNPERGGDGGRERDRPVYIHKLVEDTDKQLGAAHAEAFSTNTGDWRNQAHDSIEDHVESRVSVAQLRHSFMEGATSTTTQASRRNEL